jgi:hypothetical protein
MTDPFFKEIKELQDMIVAETSQQAEMNKTYGSPLGVEDGLKLIGTGLMYVALAVASLGVTMVRLREDERRI